MSKPEMTDDNGEEVEKKEQRCQKCGYKWEYKGDLYYGTCPRCNNKTPTWRHPQEGDKVTTNGG